eukprot:TRINITY_DN66199_c0_g1_i2.p1 TRINITY_DN66199_c0_g1~~TRINITY_DN66199_c0_g1_i2.p1  ORF type:complete len:451 (-),score=68.78 TRINITY_DN66199_c0_g1_i2:147-1499(-)
MTVAQFYIHEAPELHWQVSSMHQSVGHIGRLSFPSDFGLLPNTMEQSDMDDMDSKPNNAVSGPRIFVLCMLVDVGALLAFRLRQRFDTLLLGQLVITLVVAYGLYFRFPRLLGRPFWGVFLLFFATTIGLWLFTHASLQEVSLEPLALAPAAAGYREEALGLPPASTISNQRLGYPVCNQRWGHANLSAESRLNVFDLANLALASSYPLEGQIRSNLQQVFGGTALGDWNLTYVAPPDIVGRWIVVDFPQQRTRVVAVRGTSTSDDVYADLEIYGGIGVFQLMNFFTPVLQVLGADTIRFLVNTPLPIFWSNFLKAVREEKEAALAAGSTLVITGHSLGAALAGVAAADSDVEALGFSGPGLFYQTKHLMVDLEALERVFTNVQPFGDMVPRVDRQHGTVAWVKCESKIGVCHKLTKTSCELWARCTDPRERDFRRTCSQWYTEADIDVQ